MNGKGLIRTSPSRASQAAAVAALAVGTLAPGIATGAPIVLVNNDFTNASRTSNPQGGTNTSGATGVTGLDAEVIPGGGITNSWNGTTNDYVVATNNNGAMAGSAGGPAFFDAINVTSTDNGTPPNSGINGNSLRVMNLGAAWHASTYFAPQTLANGESLSASFNVKTTKLNPTNAAGAFRVGLFNSSGTQLTANSATLASGNVFDDDRGYIGSYTTGTGTFTPLINDRGTNVGASVFGGSTTSLGGTATPGGQVTANTTYAVSLTITRSADGLTNTITTTFGDGEGAYTDASLTTTDAASPYATFDHLGIFFGSQFGAGTNAPANFIDDVLVTLTPVPEPAGLALIGLAGVGLLARRRRASV